MTTQIKIGNLVEAMKEPEMLSEVLHRMQQYENAYVSVCPTPRNENGWLEWQLKVIYENKMGSMTIGAIQRQIGGVYEFCS